MDIWHYLRLNQNIVNKIIQIVKIRIQMKWKFQQKTLSNKGKMMANEMNNLVVRLSLDNVNFRQGIANSGRAVRTLQNEL